MDIECGPHASYEITLSARSIHAATFSRLAKRSRRTSAHAPPRSATAPPTPSAKNSPAINATTKPRSTSPKQSPSVLAGFACLFAVKLCFTVCVGSSICGLAAGGRAALFIGAGVRKSRTFPQIERQSRFLAEGQKLRWPNQSKIALSGRSKILRNQLNTAISRQLSAGSSQLRQCPY